MQRIPWSRMHRVWPRSLSGRMACILVAGLLAAQALTSTIWFDRRQSDLMDVPLRILAVRAAATMKLLQDQSREEQARTIALLTDHRFHPSLLAAPPGNLPPPHPPSEEERLIKAIALDRLGRPAYIWVLNCQLLGDSGRPAGTWSMLEMRSPSVRYSLVLHEPGKPLWLRVDGVEGVKGIDTHRLGTIADYFLRIYALRIVIVVLIALFAVRLAMKPLARMTQAAEALGTDINSPPLESRGPVEVRRAAEAFNRMQARLIDSLAERSRFLAAVSHDLRSPITRLRLRTELLPAEDLREKFRSELADMEAMIDATLTFTQSGEGDTFLSEVDVNVLLDEVATSLRELGAEVTVTGRAAAPLVCFRLSFRRCLQNLIENAVRYGARADIEVRDGAEELEIVISDIGPGIPEPELVHVLEPFYRLESSRSSNTGGFGLGLSIANAVARVHGGSLQIANGTECGLIVRLRIPRKAKN